MGAVISPVLCNVYLHRLDRQWAERGRGVLVRYADDLLAICKTKRDAEGALEALSAILAEMGLELKQAKTRIVHLREGGEGVDFLGFHHRYVRGNTRRSRHLTFLVRWPSRQAMGHAPPAHPGDHGARAAAGPCRSDRARPQPVLARRYFRYGNSAQFFDKITLHALRRLAGFIAQRHKRRTRYGWWVVAHQTHRMGLIDLNGTIVPPRANRSWRPGS